MGPMSRLGLILSQKWLTPTPIVVAEGSVQSIPETAHSASSRPVLHTDVAGMCRFVCRC